MSMGRLSLVAALAAVSAARRAPGDERPNLVLYFPDTIAAEAMGAYGHPVVQTPFFDAFAANATLFETAYSSYPQCSPSRVALVTGRHVHTLGHRTMTHLVQTYEQNLWRYLKDSGYTTVHLGKNDMLSQDSFNVSFTYWQSKVGISQGPNSYPYRQEGYYAFMAGPGSQPGNDSAANGDLASVEQALAFMRDPNVPEPFAIFIAGLGAHPPYGYPKDYANMYDPAVIRQKAPLRPLNDTQGKPPYYGQGGIRHYRNYSDFDDSYSYEVAANYFARVTYSDWIFGQLVQGIDALALTGRTVVAFSSDHGDFFGNYGLVEKWSGSGDSLLLHVPLAVRLPGAPAGVRVPDPVQIFDLMPTFMELAGIRKWLCSDTNVTGYVQFGTSLLPWIAGNASAAHPHKYVFSEGGYFWQNELEYNDPTQNSTWQDPTSLYWPRGQEEHLAPSHSVRFVVMRNATYKMVYRASGTGISELYDLQADPQELTNVWGSPAYASVQATMLMDMLDWFVLTGDVTEGVYDPRSLPPSPAWPWGPGSRATGKRNGVSHRLRQGHDA